MTFRDEHIQIDTIAAQLPFAVEDHEAAGRVFVDWTETKSEDSYRLCLIWLYCHTRRYFMVKFASRSALDATDAETLMEGAFDRILKRMEDIDQPERFAHYASVTCHRAFSSYWRKRKRTPETEILSDDSALETAPGPEFDSHDRKVLQAALEAAFKSLPPFLEPVARLRFIEGQSYGMMEHELGLPVATLRAYVFKVRSRLQEDPVLRELWAE